MKLVKKLVAYTIISVLILSGSMETFASEVEELSETYVTIHLDDKTVQTKIYTNYAVTLFKSEDLKGTFDTDKDYLDINELQSNESIVIKNTPDGFKISKKTTKRNYDWYLNQTNTGEHSLNNCGPTVGAMARKWIDEKFIMTPKEARENLEKDGLWWTTDDLLDFVNQGSSSSYIKDFYDINDIKEEIIKGNIAIACLDISKLNQKGSGHFIIIHNYEVIDGELFFITNDPYLNGMKNNSKYRGEDKLYKAEDIDIAIKGWWKNIIVVGGNYE